MVTSFILWCLLFEALPMGAATHLMAPCKVCSTPKAYGPVMSTDVYCPLFIAVHTHFSAM